MKASMQISEKDLGGWEKTCTRPQSLQGCHEKVGCEAVRMKPQVKCRPQKLDTSEILSIPEITARNEKRQPKRLAMWVTTGSATGMGLLRHVGVQISILRALRARRALKH